MCQPTPGEIHSQKISVSISYFRLFIRKHVLDTIMHYPELGQLWESKAGAVFTVVTFSFSFQVES